MACGAVANAAALLRAMWDQTGSDCRQKIIIHVVDLERQLLAKSIHPPAVQRFLPFISIFLLIGVVHALWLMVFWPGVLSEDTLAVLLEIKSDGKFESGKPTFWYYFVEFFYQPRQLVEKPIFIQLLLFVGIYSRILAWCWERGLKGVFYFSLIFICLAPQVMTWSITLYSDGPFSVAVAGLLFELWLVMKTRKVSLASFLVIAVVFPFAVFARANGAIFILSALAAVFFLGWGDKLRMVLIVSVWSLLVLWGSKLHPTHKHEVLFPLALFETVNFLQPRPMSNWEPVLRVSPKTIDTLTRHRPLQDILAGYDRDYWDSLVYKADGPQLLGLGAEDKNVLVQEFLRYNLWQSFPAFLSSRVNIFFVSLFAQGAIIYPEHSKHYINAADSKSDFRKFHYDSLELTFKKVLAFSKTYRLLLWTPLLGIFLTFYLACAGFRSKNIPVLIVCLPMVVQLGAIFLLSIAGEYRYLLHFFMVPLAFLPMYATLRQEVGRR